MKFFPLAAALFFSFLIFIVAFQNLAAKTTYFLLLFASVDGLSPFFIILIVSFLGTLTGIFATLSVFEFLKKEDNSSDDSSIQ